MSIAYWLMQMSIDAIRPAAIAIEGAVERTALTRSRTPSEMLGSSFKDRGSLFKLLSMSELELKAGIIAASAGNHAQGVAYHAQRLGALAAIVMPEFTPYTKVEGVKRFGAEAILQGQSLKEAGIKARRLEQERRLT